MAVALEGARAPRAKLKALRVAASLRSQQAAEAKET
jgi:hypothetical protein